MKKLFIVFVFVLFSVSFINSSFAITIPKDYRPYVENGAINTYKHKTKEVYAIVVKINEADITFGGNVGYYDEDTYYKSSIEEHWLYNSNSNTAVIINGQFFDIIASSYWEKYKFFTDDPARLVFPVKSNWRSVCSNIYDNNYYLRSLLITDYGQVYILDNYYQSLFDNDFVKEYLVGLYPSAVKDPYNYIGRNYIGGIPKYGCDPKYYICEYEYLIFFIAEAMTHDNMLSQMTLWSIPTQSRIMMDGSGSAQMYLYTDESPTILNGDGRLLPNSIIINNRGKT